jgi:hypothetical protein
MRSIASRRSRCSATRCASPYIHHLLPTTCQWLQRQQAGALTSTRAPSRGEVSGRCLHAQPATPPVGCHQLKGSSANELTQVAYREPYRYFEGDRFQTFAFETYDVGHTEWKDARSGTLMEFVATVDLAPMAARRGHFASLGGFHEGFSAKGEPGPGLGIELSARAWLAGCGCACWDVQRCKSGESWYLLGFDTARQKTVLERWTNPKPLQTNWDRAAI